MTECVDTDGVFKILMIEDDENYVTILRERLSEVGEQSFIVTHASDLEIGLNQIKEGRFDAILLDLSLPDNRGLEGLGRIREKAADLPIVVLTGLDNQKMGVEALRSGAQDYLVKGDATSREIAKSIRYAIERQQMQTALKNESLIDDLTSLYNRRGFFNIVQQQLKLALRTRRDMLLIFIDVDRFKQINDTYGHLEGDRALVDLAEILKKSFRETDVTGRLGGDEFAVLAIEASLGQYPNILGRLKQRISNFNSTGRRQFELSVSVGAQQYDSLNPCTMEELIRQADQKMYELKKRAEG
ncbi:MAG: GGDEF domain-containing response regulator [Candidatus Omnitrophota bacterium]